MSVVKFIIILLSGLEFAVATFSFLEPPSSIIILEDPKGGFKCDEEFVVDIQ